MCIRDSHNIEPSSLPWIFKTMLSAMGYRFYTSWTSVSSHDLCTVKPSYDYLTPQLCQTAAPHFEAFFQVGRTNLDAVNKLNERNSAWRQFCQWNSYWRRLAIKFSHEPKIAVQISWRTESESKYVWTWANQIWVRIHVDLKILRIRKYPDTCRRRRDLIRHWIKLHLKGCHGSPVHFV